MLQDSIDNTKSHIPHSRFIICTLLLFYWQLFIDNTKYRKLKILIIVHVSN